MTFKVNAYIRRGATEKPLPSAPQLAANAGKAVARNVAALVTGKGLMLANENAEQRHSVCRQCEFYRASDDRCAHPKCGCRLRFKTRLKAERCPAGKW